MSEPKKADMDDSSLVVTVTVGDLRALVRQEIERASGQAGHQTKLLTAEELADRLNIPLSWVYEQSRLGNLPTHRIGRYIRFDLNEVIEGQKKE